MGHGDAHRQIDQIHRRVILDETIPHEEKVFSVFEEYTEWVSKGKARASKTPLCRYPVFGPNIS